MSKNNKWALLVTVGLVLGACGDPAEPPERIVTALECEPGNPDVFNCAMELQEPGGLRLDLETHSCGAHGNTLRLLQPIQEVLTTDACYADPDEIWTFPGPYEEGTVVELEFVSAKLRFPPGVQVTGEYPAWVVNFEDGGDDDFNDLVLTVTAEPVN